MGRRQKPFQASWGEIVPGLAHDTDGKWRISTGENIGKKWREADERKAVAKGKALLGLDTADSTTITVTLGDILPGLTNLDDLTEAQAERYAAIVNKVNADAFVDDDSEEEPALPDIKYRIPVPDAILWPWLAKLLLDEPEFVAKKTGDMRLMGLRHMAGGSPVTVKLADVIANYEQHGKATAKSKARAVKVFNEMVEQTGAKTLADLTTERLLAFRTWVETHPKKQSGTYKVWYYGCVKAIIGFGLKTGLNTEQVTATLGRCKVLWTGTPSKVPDPTPISPDDVHALLGTASPLWRAMILVGLNCALHLEEVCALEWKSFDMKGGTYATIRTKTEEDRIPRAAVLWPETITAMNALPRKPRYVFTANHGTRYNRAARGNKFALLRERAKVSDAVTFDWIKDGAYTAAINDPGVEERFARVLCGHRSPGLQDNYVLRFPRCTAGACEAVYKHYGPFPEAGR